MTLRDELAAALGERVGALEPVGGGSINEAWRAVLGDGTVVFVKAHADPPPGTFAAEAAGLGWLRGAPGAPAVPGVLGHAEGWLALEWVDVRPGGLDHAGEERLGREVAALHAAGAPAFGATPGGAEPMRIGPLVLPNDPAGDWGAFYAERRLLPLVALAEDQDALPAGAAARIERGAGRIEALAGPAEPPARLHGDLWSGNVLAGPAGAPYVVDPAAHGGHREIDLAMLRLFGGPSARFHAAYSEAAPLADGHAERVELWQLLPLLVHAVLFGGGYGARADRAAARYA